jgi:hypothetical protein
VATDPGKGWLLDVADEMLDAQLVQEVTKSGRVQARIQSGLNSANLHQPQGQKDLEYGV